jgi:hypothetical protein
LEALPPAAWSAIGARLDLLAAELAIAEAFELGRIVGRKIIATQTRRARVALEAGKCGSRLSQMPPPKSNVFRGTRASLVDRITSDNRASRRWHFGRLWNRGSSCLAPPKRKIFATGAGRERDVQRERNLSLLGLRGSSSAARVPRPQAPSRILTIAQVRREQTQLVELREATAAFGFLKTQLESEISGWRKLPAAPSRRA